MDVDDVTSQGYSSPAFDAEGYDGLNQLNDDTEPEIEQMSNEPAGQENHIVQAPETADAHNSFDIGDNHEPDILAANQHVSTQQDRLPSFSVDAPSFEDLEDPQMRHVKEFFTTKYWVKSNNRIRKCMRGRGVCEAQGSRRRKHPAIISFHEDIVEEPPEAPPVATPWLTDAAAAKERKKFIRTARNKVVDTQFHRMYTPAALRDRRRENYVHPVDYRERFENDFLVHIENGDLHAVMSTWKGEFDLGYYLLMPKDDRSHPLLTAMHHMQLDIFAFFLAVGLDIRQKGSVHPYTGDNLSTERDRLRHITPRDLWQSLLSANSLDGLEKRSMKQLRGFSAFFDVEPGEAAAAGRAHMWRIKGICEAEDHVSNSDKTWLASLGKKWTTYHKRGPLPAANAFGEDYWCGVMLADHPNPANLIDLQANNFTSLSSWKKMKLVAAPVKPTAPPKPKAPTEHSVLLQLGTGVLSAADNKVGDAVIPAEFLVDTAEDTGFDPFYYPPTVSQHLRPLLDAICNTYFSAKPAQLDDIQQVVWGWTQAFASIRRATAPEMTVDSIPATDEGIADAVYMVASTILAASGAQVTRENARSLLLQNRDYLQFLAAVKRLGSPNSQDHAMLHAVHRIRPGVVRFLLAVGCPWDFQGTVHPWLGDDFAVEDLVRITPHVLLEKYLSRMAMQSKRKFTLLKEIQGYLSTPSDAVIVDIPSTPVRHRIRKSAPQKLISRQEKHQWLYNKTSNSLKPAGAAPATVLQPVPKPQNIIEVSSSSSEDDSTSSSSSEEDSTSTSSSSNTDSSATEEDIPHKSSKHRSSKHDVAARLERKMTKNNSNPLHDDHPEYAIDLRAPSDSESAGSSTSSSSTSTKRHRKAGKHHAGDDNTNNVSRIKQKHGKKPARRRATVTVRNTTQGHSRWSIHEPLDYAPITKPKYRKQETSVGVARKAVNERGNDRLSASNNVKITAGPTDKSSGRISGIDAHTSVPQLKRISAADARMPVPQLKRLPMKNFETAGAVRLVTSRAAKTAIPFEDFAAGMQPSMYDLQGTKKHTTNQPSSGEKRPREGDRNGGVTFITASALRHHYFQYTLLLNKIEQLQRWHKLLANAPQKKRTEEVVVSLEHRLPVRPNEDRSAEENRHHMWEPDTPSLDAYDAVPDHDAGMWSANDPKQDAAAAAFDVTGELTANTEIATPKPAHSLAAPDTMKVELEEQASTDDAASATADEDECDVVEVAVPESFWRTLPRPFDLSSQLQQSVAKLCTSSNPQLREPWLGICGPLMYDDYVHVQVKEADSDGALPEIVNPTKVLDDTIGNFLFALEYTSDPITALSHMITSIIPIYFSEIEDCERQLAEQLFDLDEPSIPQEMLRKRAKDALTCIVLALESIKRFLRKVHADTLQCAALFLEGIANLVKTYAAQNGALFARHIIINLPCAPCKAGESSIASYVLASSLTLTWFTIDILNDLKGDSSAREILHNAAKEVIRLQLLQSLQVLLDFPGAFVVNEPSIDAETYHAPALYTLLRVIRDWNLLASAYGLGDVLSESRSLLSVHPISWFVPFLHNQKDGKDIVAEVVADWRVLHWELWWEFRALVVSACDVMPSSVAALPELSNALFETARQNPNWPFYSPKKQTLHDMMTLAIRRAARVSARLSQLYAIHLVPDVETVVKKPLQQLENAQLWLQHLQLWKDRVQLAYPVSSVGNDIIQYWIGMLRVVFEMLKRLPDEKPEDHTQLVLCRPVDKTTIASAWDSCASAALTPYAAEDQAAEDPRSLCQIPEWLLRAAACGASVPTVYNGVLLNNMLGLNNTSRKTALATQAYSPVQSTSLYNQALINFAHSIILHLMQQTRQSPSVRKLVSQQVALMSQRLREKQIVTSLALCVSEEDCAARYDKYLPKSIVRQPQHHFLGHPAVLWSVMVVMTSLLTDEGASSPARIERLVSNLIDVTSSDAPARLLFCQVYWAATMLMRRCHPGFRAAVEAFCACMWTLAENSMFDIDTLRYATRRDAGTDAGAKGSSAVTKAATANPPTTLLLAVNAWKKAYPDLSSASVAADTQLIQHLAVLQLVFDAMSAFVDGATCSSDADGIQFISEPTSQRIVRYTNDRNAVHTEVTFAMGACFRKLASILLEATAQQKPDRVVACKLTLRAALCAIDRMNAIRDFSLRKLMEYKAPPVAADTTMQDDEFGADCSFLDGGALDDLAALEAVLTASEAYSKACKGAVESFVWFWYGSATGPSADAVVRLNGVLSDLEKVVGWMCRSWLLGLQKHGLSTTTLLKVLHQQLPYTSHDPGAYLTGLADTDDSAEELGAGFSDFITLVVAFRCIIALRVQKIEFLCQLGKHDDAAKALSDVILRYAAPLPENLQLAGVSVGTFWAEHSLYNCCGAASKLISATLSPLLLSSLLLGCAYRPTLSGVPWSGEQIVGITESITGLFNDATAVHQRWSRITQQETFSKNRAKFAEAFKRILCYNSGAVQSVLLRSFVSQCISVPKPPTPADLGLVKALACGLSWVYDTAFVNYPLQSFPEFTEQLRACWASVHSTVLTTFHYDWNEFRTQFAENVRNHSNGSYHSACGMYTDTTRLANVSRYYIAITTTSAVA